MRVLLVNPGSDHAFTKVGFIMPPLGLAYVAAYLREAGHEVCIHDLTVDDTVPDYRAFDLYVFMGIESAHQCELDAYLKKASTEHAQGAVKLLKRNGIETLAAYIPGAPDRLLTKDWDMFGGKRPDKEPGRRLSGDRTTGLPRRPRGRRLGPLTACHLAWFPGAPPLSARRLPIVSPTSSTSRSFRNGLTT